MERPKTRYTKTVDGVHIAYQVFGDGPVDIAYTPGFVSNIDTAWDLGHHADYFAGLASIGRVIIFDRRSTGLSDRPDRVESLALELGINDLIAVLDAAEATDPVLIGFEDGATMCCMFAAANPDRVRALVLFAPWVKGSPSADYPWAYGGEALAEWDRRVAEQWGTEEFSLWNLEQSSPTLAKDPQAVAEIARYFASCASPGRCRRSTRCSHRSMRARSFPRSRLRRWS